jgi:hypothetical protein
MYPTFERGEPFPDGTLTTNSGLASVARKTSGQNPADLTVEEVWVIGEPEAVEILPDRIVALLGLEPGDTVGKLFDAMNDIRESGETATAEVAIRVVIRKTEFPRK